MKTVFTIYIYALGIGFIERNGQITTIDSLLFVALKSTHSLNLSATTKVLFIFSTLDIDLRFMITQGQNKAGGYITTCELKQQADPTR